MNPEIFCPPGNEWIGVQFIRTPQTVVRRNDVLRFADLYLSGVVLPPPECYIHPVTKDYVIMDGNHRATAFTALLKEGHFYEYFFGNFAIPVAVSTLRPSRLPDKVNSLNMLSDLRFI